MIIAMDEFQQILKFPEKDTEGYLRTIIQEMPELNFIFSGSDQHLLHQMFTGYNKPFYQMSQMMKLGEINSDIYSEFILNHFSKAGKKIEIEDIEYILEWTNGITYYVQVICNRVFAQKTKKINRFINLQIKEQLNMKYKMFSFLNGWQGNFLFLLLCYCDVLT